MEMSSVSFGDWCLIMSPKESHTMLVIESNREVSEFLELEDFTPSSLKRS
jgi:hypothetical protein